ncbi:hypothetical protein J5839_01090 [Methanosarcinaceae archaeon]|nr:hypothetical protein [Methanosarcinaceae archaeon]
MYAMSFDLFMAILFKPLSFLIELTVMIRFLICHIVLVGVMIYIVFSKADPYRHRELRSKIRFVNPLYYASFLVWIPFFKVNYIIINSMLSKISRLPDQPFYKYAPAVSDLMYHNPYTAPDIILSFVISFVVQNFLYACSETTAILTDAVLLVLFVVVRRISLSFERWSAEKNKD